MDEAYSQEHLDYLQKIKFEKRLNQLEKKLKNKKILLYGAGTFLHDLLTIFDLSRLNIIGITDRSFKDIQQGETCFGYTKYKIDDIPALSPDYILVCTLNFVNIIENLEQTVNKKTKIRPLIKKPLKDLWAEIYI